MTAPDEPGHHFADPRKVTAPDQPDLAQRIAEALTREHYRRAAERIEASPEEHQAAFADVVMGVVQPVLDRLTEDLRIEQCAAARLARLYQHHKQRAEQAEELLRIAHDTSNRSEAERARAVQRAQAAEDENTHLRDAAARLAELERQI